MDNTVIKLLPKGLIYLGMKGLAFDTHEEKQKIVDSIADKVADFLEKNAAMILYDGEKLDFVFCAKRKWWQFWMPKYFLTNKK